MKKTRHNANSRGFANHGWLKSKHSFSFAEYHNEERMHFGALRVLNDDVIDPSAGFGTHPHNNMEIISVPIYGSLRHQDSMGNKHVISMGEIQIMSAGSGISHSEYNNSDEEECNFLQIWILPKDRNIEPRYGQKYFDFSEKKNKFHLIIAPQESAETLWINQDAYISLADIEAGKSLEYKIHKKDNGVYFFLITGLLKIDDEELHSRDALGLEELESAKVHATEYSRLLAIEIPM